MNCVDGARRLGSLGAGHRGRVQRLEAANGNAETAEAALIAERLRELGFVEDARIEVLHAGPFGGDPIAVKVDQMIVALRRREADAIFVTVDGT